MLGPVDKSAIEAVTHAVRARLRALVQARNFMVFLHDVAMAWLAFVAAFYLRLGDRAFEMYPGLLTMAAAFAAVAAEESVLSLRCRLCSWTQANIWNSWRSRP